MKSEGTSLRKKAEFLIEKGVCTFKDVDKYIEELEGMLRKIPSEQELRRVAEFYKTLSDPFRIKLIYLLSFRSMNVCELTVAMDTTQPTVTHHLKILEHMHIINRKRVGRWTYYELKYKEVLDNINSILKFKPFVW